METAAPRDGTAQHRVEASFREHAAAVRRYALRRVGDEAADDVVQAVFLVAARRAEDLPDEPLPWLYGIAWNEVLKTRSRSDRRARLTARLASVTPPTAPDGISQVLDRAWVLSFLETLPPTDAELLRLVVWEDLEASRAAEILGIRPGTAHVRLHRLRRRLSRLVDTASGRPVEEDRP